MSAKRIEMLKEVLPGLKKLGVLHNATDPTFSAWGEQTMSDAKKLGIEPIRVGTSTSTSTVTEHFRHLSELGGTAMVVVRDFLTTALMSDICKNGVDARVAVVGEHSEFSRSGVLFSYGEDFADLFRRSAGYVDRILNGEKVIYQYNCLRNSR